MKKRILATLLAVAIGHQTYAEYGIRVFIEPTSIKIGNQTPPVDPTDPEPETPESEINSFSVNKNKFTIGESAIFSWNVSNSTALILQPYGTVSNSSTGQSVSLSSIGDFDYTLRSTSADGSFKTSNTLNISVYGEPNINSFTVNGLRNITVEEGDELSFDFNQTNGDEVRINSNIINGNNWTTSAPSSNQNYTLTVKNGADRTVDDQVTVNIVQPLSIDSFTAPSNVFINEAFNLTWTGSNVISYELTTPDGVENLNMSTSKSITPSSIGLQSYTLKATNAANKTKQSQKQVTVESLPTFTGFTVNDETSVTVSVGDSLNYASTGNSADSILVGRNSENTSDVTNPIIAPSAGTYTYYAATSKTLNNITKYSDLRSVTVISVDAPTIGTITSPSNVYDNSPFTISWTGTNVTNYKIKGNVAASGISTTDIDLGTTTNRSITPTAAGSYTYTITATNAAGVTTTSTKVVVVESDPTFTGFTVNSLASATVAPGATLTFTGSGFSTGSALQGRNSGNSANSTLPTTASGTSGSTTYYAASSKTLNGITKYSSIRSVIVTVVDAPTIGTITAPSNVYDNSAFTMSWTGTNVTNYKIRGNVSASGISTTDVDLGITANSSITPTAAGTYTYTITATNAAGVTATSTKVVIVESDPSFTGFTVNSAATVSVAPNATLTFAGAGISSGAVLQGRNSGNTANSTLPTTASGTAGSTTYYAAVTKTVNGIAKYSAIRNVSVTVVANPTISAITGPTNVFPDEAMTLSWSGSGISNYNIRGTSGSGVSTTDTNIATATSRSITPTTVGTHTYTVTAVNSVGGTATSTFNVIVESDPTFSSVTANGTPLPASLTLTPNATLNFVSSGLSSGAADILFQDGNLRGMAGSAPATAGTYGYSYTAFKTLNGVTRSAPNRTLNLTVSAPAFSFSTSPKTYVWCQQIGWSGGCSGCGQPVVRTEAYWQGTLVMSGTAINACGVSPNSNFTGTDGGSYTTGPLQSNASGLQYQIRKN